jgi:BASS family bile acid:Na+ symporter
MIDALITSILALIMFSIGLSLRAMSFRRLVTEPKVLFLGLSLQLIFLPLLAFTVALTFELPPAFATGVVVLSACPGGLTSNFISYLLKANTALAVSLTICNTCLSLFTIPLITNLALTTFWSGEGITQLPFLPTAGRIFLIVLVPVGLGLLFRARAQVQAERLQQRLRWVSIAGLGLLFTIKLFAPAEAGGSNLTLAEIAIILPASVLINVLSLFSGRAVGLLLRLRRDNQLTLGVEVGIQNTNLAFLITGTLLANEQMLKPALVYAMFTFLTALAYGLWIKPNMVLELGKEFRRLRQGKV